MRYDDWSILAAIYTTRNLTKASKILFLTQPALTARLQNIETELGCMIAARSNKGLVFTPEGELLAQNAVRIVKMSDSFIEQFRKMREMNAGIINISATTTFAHYFLPQLMKGFQERFPEVQFQLQVDVSSQILENISNGKCSCGFMNGRHVKKTEEFIFRTQQAYLVSDRARGELKEYRGLPLIIHNKNIATQTAIMEWWKRQFGEEPNIKMDVRDLDICLNMIRAGFGCSIIFGDFWKEKFPELFTRPLHIEEPGPEDRENPFERDLWFLYSNTVEQSPVMRDFVDFVREQAGQ